MMDLQWYDWVGLVGTLMVLAAYFMLQAGRLHGNGMLYQVLNLFGAAGVLASLYGSFNLSVLLLMAAWIVISGYGLMRTFKGMGAPKPPASALPR
ncbi:MAG: CBU_0592 family membrane protein [Luteimonas sp.]